MTGLDEILQYRRKVDEARERIARAEGRLEAAMEKLSHGYGCGNVEAGRRALKDLQRKTDKAQQSRDEKLEGFKSRWKEHLDG